MRYLGGKSRLAKPIWEAMKPYIEDQTVYIEPFVGGAASLAIKAPNFKEAFAGDINEDMILFYQALKDGWLPPREVSEEEYATLRNAEPSALRAFVAISCSFGGKWFGGYARGKTDKGVSRNYADESYKNLLKQIPVIKNTTFIHQGYADWNPDANTVVYADPPYAETTKYNKTGEFDHELFWKTMDEWSDRGAKVFVSEFYAPEHWTCIWEKSRKISVNIGNYSEKVDRLYTRLDG